MKMLYFAVLATLYFGVGCAHTDKLVDFEEKAQPFVLATKQIVIPGYPNAFNASIVRYQGSLLMSFRFIPDRKTPFTSYLGLVWLNNTFEPISSPQILATRAPFFPVPSRAEDARLLQVGSQLYIVYSDNMEPVISRGDFRMYIAELKHNGEKFYIEHAQCLKRFEGARADTREKNWVPFDYEGSLLLAYSLQPHLILQPLSKTEECLSVSLTEGDIQWDWGVLRGGTPALLEEGQYLSFFHSSKKMASIHSEGKTIFHYFMGAYTFQSKPPFAITGISPEPIVGKNFYNGVVHKSYWAPQRVVFPCGLITDATHIWVTYGRQDHEIWVVKLDKKGLMASLNPLRSMIH